ncbi:UNVERIFIED_CONTAM: hypothetical protein PYX00_004724 [Menopon gallinae]|uniref:BRCA1-associated RING domain protein 1 n=1 Tax=Menopon gallinae TaxID=328185 RepID=A0AAW2I678_9NEOP
MDSAVTETKENFQQINALFRKIKDIFKCQSCFQIKDEDSIVFYFTCEHFFCTDCVTRKKPCLICAQGDKKVDSVQVKLTENDSILAVFRKLSKYNFSLTHINDLEKLPKSVEKVGKSKRRDLKSVVKDEPTSKPQKTNDIQTNKKVKNVSKRNYKGETPLHLACRKGNLDLLQELIDAQACPNVQDNAGWTPLHDSVAYKRIEVVRFLLENGARVNTPGHENTTALHLAVTDGQTEIVQLLLKYGADKNARNIYGETPMDIIKKYNISNMEAIMMNTPAKFKSKSRLDQDSGYPNKAKVVLFPFNLNENETKIFKDFVAGHKYKAVDKLLPQQSATHIILSENEDAQITWNIVLGVLMACHVISVKWMKDSEDKNAVQPINRYEIQDDFYSGFLRSRQNQREQLPSLFSGCHFYFGGNFELYKTKNSSFLKIELKVLVEKHGGVILSRNPDPESLALEKTIPYHAKVDSSLSKTSYYIIYSKDQWDPAPKYNMPHMKTLPIEWLLASIFKFQLIDPSEIESFTDKI